MHLDFWNNPIVVSAFRVRYRRGGIFNITTLYLLLLVAGGMVLHYYNDRIGGPWPRNYLLALLGLQFLVSAILAVSATSASLRAEVVNRTLDFQRIAALSPRQILLGKLLGEPALAYLLAVATVPLAAWCWTLGVNGVSLAVLMLLYVNLTTHTLMFGAVGLQQNVELAPGKTSRSGGGAGLVLLAFVNVSSTAFLSAPWRVKGLAGLITPLPLFQGMQQGDPFKERFPFYGIEIPFLLIAPLTQLLVAFLCFHTMTRRLVNPLNTSLNKGLVYGALIVIDLLIGAVLAEPVPLGMAIGPRSAAFCLAHLCASLWLTNTVTPWRESLRSWVWRFRGRFPRLRDLWLGERSENGHVLVTFCGIGVVGLVVFVLLPAGLQEGFALVRQNLPVALAVLLVTSLLTLSLGSIYQWFVFIAGQSGQGVFLTFVALLVEPLHLLGYYYRIDWMLALSPTAHFVNWFSEAAPLDLVPLAILYGLLLASARLSLRRRLGRLETQVDDKLRAMGALKTT